ncbi:MAG: hypothetical protein ACT4QC_10400 [Planctomycetaceae bacterium]
MSTQPANRPKRRWWWGPMVPLVVALLWLLLVPTGFYLSLAGLPDIPAPVDIASLDAIDVPAGDNAFELYREAAAAMKPIVTTNWEQYEVGLEEGWHAIPVEFRDWLEANRRPLELFLEGSERPELFYARPMPLGSPQSNANLEFVQEIRNLARVVHLEALRREAAEDFGGAWAMYAALFRSSRQPGRNGPLIDRLIGAAVHANACLATQRWATDSRVDMGMLRQALADARSIYSRTVPLAAPLKWEYACWMKSIDAMTWAMNLAGILDRSRRVTKLSFANWLSQCDLPRPQRTKRLAGTLELYEADPEKTVANGGFPAERIADWAQRDLFAILLAPSVRQTIEAHDREQMRQAMLELALCLHIYHREQGEFPATLERLIGDDLPELPVDPFGRGEPIRYRREADPAEGAALWSVSPDGVDDKARVNLLAESGRVGDYVLRLTPPRVSH